MHMHASKKPTPQQLLSISRFPCPVHPQAHTMPETASHVADDHDDKPHVAVLANSGLGHVIPLLEFAKRLVVGHGFRVTFLVVTTVDPTPAQDQLLNAPGLPHDLHVLGLPAVDTASIVPEDCRVLTRICFVVEASLKSLEATLIELSPKVLVVDLFCTQAFDVAGKLSIPTYSFFTSSATMLAFSLYLPTLDREVTGELVDLPGLVRVPGCPSIRPDDLLDQVKDRKNEEYRWYLYHVSRLPTAAGIFLNTWEGLEPGALRALSEDSFYRQVPVPPVHAIGPLVHGDGDTEGLRSTDAECLTWLDGQPEESVVLVSLGSGGTLTREQQVEMAWGLELSQQRFLWIVRKPTDASASAAFFNVGSDEEDDLTKYLPQGFQEKTREVGMVVSSWAAQVAILSHPSIGAFLSHCGWNSSVESLAKGVPMIAWPLYAEQRTNATMLVEDVGVAIRPSIEGGRKVVGRKEIERVVRAVMRGEEGKRMRRRAREIRDSSVESMTRGGSSQASLAVVCEDWKTKSRGCEEELCADRAS
ncbi:anthocyanidin 3-O-glucosyltransferase 5-like [Syzygium oleosum]|uniref:anthocyanidin 3-O-glucosyltransferase 5-like n=1 Tax=Syzygium oleosum TaxID=219896 RepID=UPI0024BB7F79|nr:anthocyanidin 3-O-glucosyltransferase 5-like [Syzygium oleosum]